MSKKKAILFPWGMNCFNSPIINALNANDIFVIIPTKEQQVKNEILNSINDAEKIQFFESDIHKESDCQKFQNFLFENHTEIHYLVLNIVPELDELDFSNDSLLVNQQLIEKNILPIFHLAKTVIPFKSEINFNLIFCDLENKSNNLKDEVINSFSKFLINLSIFTLKENAISTENIFIKRIIFTKDCEDYFKGLNAEKLINVISENSEVESFGSLDYNQKIILV
ncbi:Rossmann-fold NAD(P)-binding domain-containing protein [Algoriphagus algorifonticola]|uniref:SDR family oxidoreductase n=1 Tax=Algoriphagus algorifonticola TaxID=2593007 RepID=UPI0011A4351D|nr:SDR family oxidoreductase [Algoriphagus algorifonticola]